ncbi:hypothetical protein BpHYR1_053401 [Brachionus plicatilis]|uniref:Uncharacterized protein n=1 Tax=Brachionus plicatilis TaxID=10195 RepID=A0A3M7QXG6_BRAPC|nr:hypothetical protein BpHYR1_053401 [Brachionus plicatilis]
MNIKTQHVKLLKSFKINHAFSISIAVKFLKDTLEIHQNSKNQQSPANSQYNQTNCTPLNIINGANIGPVRASAVFVSGETADKNVPNETAHCATKIIIQMHIIN